MRTKYIFYTISLLVIAGTISGCSLTLQTPQDAGVFYSADEGDTWQQRTFIAKGEKKDVTISSADIYQFIFHPTQEQILYVSTPSGIFKTENKGETWSPTQLQSGSYADFILDPKSPTIQYAAIGGKIFKTTTDGETWSQVYIERPGVAITSLIINPSATNIVWAATSANGLLKSDDFGNTWALTTSFADFIKDMYIPTADPTTIYAIFNSTGFTKSTDAGKTWSAEMSQGLAPFRGSVPISSFHIRLNTSNDITLSSAYGILRSTDGGVTWTPLSTVVPFNTVPVRDALIDPVDASLIYFVAGNTFYRSRDAGASWQTLKSLPTSQLITSLRINPNNYNDLFAGITKITN